MYSKTTWVNGQEPALSAENLNHIEDGLSEASYTADIAYSYARGALQESALAMTNSNNALEKAEASAEAVKNNLVYDKVSGISPITFGSLPGSAEIGLKGNCVQDTDNILTLDRAKYANLIFDTSNKKFVQASYSTLRTYWVPCRPNTTYVYVKPIGENRRIASCENEPAVNVSYNVYEDEGGLITTGANDKYLAVYPLTNQEYSSGITYEQVINASSIKGVPTPSTPIAIEYAHKDGSSNLFDIKDLSNWDTYGTSQVLRKTYRLSPYASYTISQTEDREGLAYAFIISGNDISFTPGTNVNVCTVNHPRTVIADANGYITVGVFSNAKDGIVMLNEGTTALSYEHYYKKTLVESFSKNLFDVARIENLNGKVGLSVDRYGAIYDLTGTFTFSHSGQNTNTIVYHKYIKSTKTSVPSTPVGNGFTIELSDDEMLVIRGDGSYTTTLAIINALPNAMLERGILAAKYIEYSRDAAPIPYDLLGLPGAQDEWADGIVTKAASKITLDSSVEFIYINGCFQTPGAFPSDLGSKKVGMSDMFKFEYYESGITGNLSVNAFGWTDTNKLTIRVDGITSGADFAAWLDDHKPTIVYAIEYPYAMPLPPGTKQTIHTYEEQTTITADYCNISVEATKNVLDVIDERTKEVYAEEETLIGTYLGKPLYRKVIHTRTPSTVKTDGLVYEGIKKTTHNVINMYGAIDSGEYTNPLNMFAGGDYFISTWLWDYGIQMRAGVSLYADKPCEIVVEYTKASASDRSAEPMMLAEEVAE